MDGLMLRVLASLLDLGICAAVLLASIWLRRVVRRERMLRRVEGRVPVADRRMMRRHARQALRVRWPEAPSDPYALTVPVTVQPEEGWPGWAVMAPGPARPPGPTDSRQSRTDAIVALERGTYMLVVRLGRVGHVLEGYEVLPAHARADSAHDDIVPQVRTLGPVARVDLPLGEGWRTTWVWEHSGKALTDTHVDYEGWGYVVGVFSSSYHARAVDVLDRILATWHWLPLPMTTSGPPSR